MMLGWTRVLLALGAAMALVGCGDDDRSPRDSGPIGVDRGPIPDTGPLPDRGPIPDTGPRVDSGGPAGCPSGPMYPCNVQNQTGCMAGEGCYFSGDGSMCAPAGSIADGMPCDATMLNVCREGFTCVPNSGGGMMGTCRHLCCNLGSTMGCPTGQSCSVQFVDSMGMPSGVGYCALPDDCDPAAQTGCEAGEGCYVNDFDEGSVICVEPTDDLMEGADCAGMASNDCVPGTQCIGLMMGGMMQTRCFKFCTTMGMPSGCADGQTCTSVGSAALPNLGVCTGMASM